MEDSLRTRQYLQEMKAVLIDEKIKISDCIVNSKIHVFTRKFYKKRNGKTCYVDSNIKAFDVDFKRVFYNRTAGSIEMNEHYSYHYSNSRLILHRDYKEELTLKYSKS